MKIGLIRHGKTEWNALGKIQGQTDIPLNEEGLTQARLLADRLVRENERWDAVVTSDLSRAAETGRIVAEAIGVPLLPGEPLLRERSFGLIEGTTEAERIETWGADWRSSSKAGVESDASVQDRAAAFLAKWRNNMPEANLLVVSHGSYLAQMLALMCEHLDNSYIGNMSFSVLEFKDNRWDPVLHNCTLHLQ
ncbi:histidine phosphatase family protein [Paenibacillus beijingensis]|uniref:Phosphoglycerate kinase n=1 Tax=Paenibacillus beijingensis TaxID=1126833 RepID=A0A0D5NQG8_9BACL|nr:histidine phosphatase family protein [Paenibacillus beijingensis]AJY77153.1 phosphoglycerate kinase [Paenibacillus beijingensis]